MRHRGTYLVLISAAILLGASAEAFAAAQVRLTWGATEIPYNGSFDFGTTGQGTPLGRNFVVHNDGSTPLSLSGLQIPAGYQVAEPLPGSIPAGGEDNFSVRLTGNSTGTFTGQIRFNHSGANAPSPFTFNVTGTVEGPAPEIRITHGGNPVPFGSTFDFGTTPAGTYVGKNFVVHNDGNSSLVVSQITVPPGYQLVGSLDPIPAGSSDNFAVRLTGNSAGFFTGLVRLYHNATNVASPASFTVTGTVEAPGPSQLRLTWGGAEIPHGGSFDFGTTPQGTPLGRNFVVHNDGDSILTFSNLTVPPGYSIVGQPPSSIPPGGEDNFAVRLTGALAGVFTGQIRFNHSAGNVPSPFVFNVTGTVEGPGAPSLRLTWGGAEIPHGGSFDFGTTPQGTPLGRNFVVHNDGGSPLSFSNLTVPSGYAVVGQPPSSIPAGGEGNFAVRLTGALAGVFTGQIRFSHNAGGVPSPFQFNVTGTVTAPGAPAVRLTHGGTEVPYGSRFTFGATTTGTPISKNFVLHNHGETPLSVSGLALPPGYQVITPPPASIPAGGSDNFSVRLLATTPGTFTGQIRFNHNADDDPSPFLFNVVATVGVLEPAVRVAQGSSPVPYGTNVGFGSTEAGQPVTRTFRVHNDGNAALSLSGADVPAGFQLIAPPPPIVSPGTFGTFTVQLTAAAAGGFSGDVSFSHDAGNEPDPFRFTVSGTVSGNQVDNAAVVTFSAPSPVTCGESFPAAVTLTNTGTTTWASPYAFGILGGLDPFYSGPPVPVAGSVSPGANHTFQLELTAPSTPGPQQTRWRMRNASGAPFGAAASTFIEVECGGGDEPTIDAVAPYKVFQGDVATLAVTGVHLQGASVEIGDEPFDPGDPSRVYPFVQSFSTNAAGTRIDVTVNAVQAGIDGYYNLIVTTPSGLDAIEIRVVPERPVVDMYTPSEVAPGAFFMVSINGANLAGTSVTASTSQVRLVAFDSSDDQAITALLAVEDSPPASFHLTVSGNGGTAILPMTSTSGSAPFQLQTVDLLEKLSPEEISATFHGLPSPKIYFQEPRLHDGIGFLSQLTLSEAAAKAKALEEAGMEKGFNCLFRYTARLFSFTRVFVIPLDELGSFDPGVLQGLGLGEVAQLGALTFSVFTDLAIRFTFDSCRFTDFNFCIFGNLGFEVPGIAGVITSFQFCFPFGFGNFEESVQTTGSAINSFTFTSPGLCTTVIPTTSPEEGGMQMAEVKLIECCTETISATVSGQTFVDTIYGGNFAGTVAVVTATPEATCEPEGAVLKVFLDADDDNTYTPGSSIPLSQLTDLESYVPCATGSGTSVAPSALPQEMRLVAAFVNLGTDSAVIVPPPAGTSGVTFELGETSAFKGIAGNSGAQTSPDFSLAGGAGTTATVPFDSSHVAKVALSCHDYGGFTRVTATASSGETETVRIPRAGNDGLLPAGGWRTFAGAQVSGAGLVAGQDVDNDPAVSGNPDVGQIGDGLSNYEEFRGFIVRGEHRRTHPFHKDVFLSSNLYTGAAFASPNLPTATHRVYGQDEPQANEYGPGREINFNHTNSGDGGGVAGHSTQRAIRGVSIDTAPSVGLFGRWFPMGAGGGLGSPNETDRIEVYIDTHFDLGGPPYDFAPSQVNNEVRRSYGHEVGHGLHICHRPPTGGCPDPVGPEDSVMSSDVFPNNGQTNPVSLYNFADTAQIRVHQKF